MTLSWCEPSGASTLSKEHIREVGPEGLLLGGGIKTPALCGYDLRGGWDNGGHVTVEYINATLACAEINPLCTECAEKALALLA